MRTQYFPCYGHDKRNLKSHWVAQHNERFALPEHMPGETNRSTSPDNTTNRCFILGQM